MEIRLKEEKLREKIKKKAGKGVGVRVCARELIISFGESSGQQTPSLEREV